MAEPRSEGKCLYCDKMFKSAGIGRHLTTHLKALEKESRGKGRSFHLKISSYLMFLHLLVDGTARFRDLDGFLRAIWLECCGHLSSFQVKGKQYDFEWGMDHDFGEKMSNRVSSVLKKGMKLVYEYDFGSTTRLDVTVVNEYAFKTSQDIILLSRNEPLPFLCEVCRKKPAVFVCNIHYYGEDSMFCPDCAEKHGKECPDFEDYAKMPVVNSPRMGVCGYEGGEIDLERDGVWKG